MKEIHFDFVPFLHVTFFLFIARADDLERFCVDKLQGGASFYVMCLGCAHVVLVGGVEYVFDSCSDRCCDW
jgi:hypothetical protein